MAEFKSNKQRDFEMQQQLKSEGVDTTNFSSEQYALLHKIKESYKKHMVVGTLIGLAAAPIIGVGLVEGAVVGAVAGIGIRVYGSAADTVEAMFTKFKLPNKEEETE